MAITNKSKYAILGILNIEPGSGYDIKKYCDTVISDFWNENYGHIYPMLRSLTEDGLIIQTEAENSRSNCYEITDAGRKELLGWLMDETTEAPIRSEFMLKFLFSSSLQQEEVVHMLLKYKEKQAEKLIKGREMLKKLDQGIKEITSERAKYIRAILNKSILSAESSIAWCESTLKEFEL